jgi:ABC-2 type transport system ATP-binding protein
MIHLENLTKEYESTSGSDAPTVAADRLTLEIAAGEVFGLVGANGAGKTTTLKMICGLSVPTAGRVTVNGIDVEKQPEEAQRYIGYLGDFFELYDDLKVWEYLDYFARAYKIDPAKSPVRITEVIHRMGLYTKRDSLIAGLSRGMKQRLGIGRAILHDPPLLVLDEPASGLDPKARVELKDLLRELNRAGKTIFITSHILSDLEEICTSIAVMEKGRVLRVGPLAEVMRQDKTHRRFRLRLAAPGFALDQWLSQRPGITEIKTESASTEFSIAASDAEVAALLREAINAGAPICALEELTESLEQLYSRLSPGEVM